MIIILLTSTYLSSSRSALLIFRKKPTSGIHSDQTKINNKNYLQFWIHWNMRVLKKRLLEPTNSAYVLVECSALITVTTPHPRHRQKLFLGQLPGVNTRLSKDNTLSYQLQAHNKMILHLWKIPNPSYDTKYCVTFRAWNLNDSAQFKAMRNFNIFSVFNT